MKGERLELSRRERVAVGLLTGPAGRAWSFARDVGSILRLLVSFALTRRRRGGGAAPGEPG